jgi:hypothetical protein
MIIPVKKGTRRLRSASMGCPSIPRLRSGLVPVLTGKKDDLSFPVKGPRYMLNGQHKNNQNLNPQYKGYY